jgi:hypothetical protein
VQSKTGIANAAIYRPNNELSASDIAKIDSKTPAYIGWRTCAYGPVEITHYPASTITVEAANVFPRNTRRKKPEHRDDQ